MATSDFLREATERGFVFQCTDAEALDAALRAGPVAAYIGFDCTADSLHVGSLVQIMMLRLLQRHGHRPIVLMGGGTTRIGDPSGKDESRPAARPTRRSPPTWPASAACFDPFLRFGDGPSDAHHGQQRRLAGRARLHPAAARRRHAFHRQPHADLRQRAAAAGARAAADLPRIQLHDPAELRFPRAEPPLRLRAADRRLRPVGQHRLPASSWRGAPTARRCSA